MKIFLKNFKPTMTFTLIGVIINKREFCRYLSGEREGKRERKREGEREGHRHRGEKGERSSRFIVHCSRFTIRSLRFTVHGS